MVGGRWQVLESKPCLPSTPYHLLNLLPTQYSPPETPSHTRIDPDVAPLVSESRARNTAFHPASEADLTDRPVDRSGILFEGG